MHNARLERLQMSHRKSKRVNVVADVVPRSGGLKLKAAQGLHLWVGVIVCFKSRVRSNGPGFMLYDITHHIPGCESGHLARVEIQLALQEFKHGSVWVAPLI